MVSIRASPNLDIIGVKFDSKPTFEDHVHGIVSSVSHRIGILRLVKLIFVDTSALLRCYFAFFLLVLEYCSSVWGSAAECHLQLLERQVYSVARLCHDQSFLSLCHRRRVVGLTMLYKVKNSNSNHSLFSERPSASTRVRYIPELRPHPIHWSLKYQGEEPPNLQGVSYRPRFECGMTFPALCLTPECWIGSRVQSTVGCFAELCFLQFTVAQVLLGLRKQFINNFVFPAWAGAAGFNNNNNNDKNNNNKSIIIPVIGIASDIL